ncbi:MAG: hypothetical protein U0R66_17515 [Mycobacterium sp.]
MSGLLDDLIPPWAKNLLVVSPVLGVLAAEFSVLRAASTKLFGTGEQPRPMPPPPPPALPPATGGSGPTQEEIDKLSEQIGQLQQQIAAMHTAADTTTGQSGANSQEGSRTNQGLLSDTAAADALAPQGSTPDAQAAALAAMQQQIDALTQNVQDKATNANGIADALRNLSTAMPSMGMPSMGMPGGGLPLGLGGLGGLGAPSVSPLNTPPAPSVTARPTEAPVKAPQVTSMAPTEPHVASAPDPTPVISTPTSVPAAAAAAGNITPAVAPAANPAKPAAAPPAAEGKQVTLPSGQVVTAPNAAAAAAVRTALSQPAGKGDVATTAYAGTGVAIPTDGAEPGRKIDPADLQPGDIAVFGDHTALVAGNGQLVGPDGKLQPLGVINDSTNFHGFFRPTETADTPAAVSSPATAGVSAPSPTPSPGSAPATLLAAPVATANANTSSAKPSAAPTPSPPTSHVR